MRSIAASSSSLDVTLRVGQRPRPARITAPRGRASRGPSSPPGRTGPPPRTRPSPQTAPARRDQHLANRDLPRTPDVHVRHFVAVPRGLQIDDIPFPPHRPRFTALPAPVLRHPQGPARPAPTPGGPASRAPRRPASAAPAGTPASPARSLPARGRSSRSSGASPSTSPFASAASAAASSRSIAASCGSTAIAAAEGSARARLVHDNATIRTSRMCGKNTSTSAPKPTTTRFCWGEVSGSPAPIDTAGTHR